MPIDSTTRSMEWGRDCTMTLIPKNNTTPESYENVRSSSNYWRQKNHLNMRWEMVCKKWIWLVLWTTCLCPLKNSMLNHKLLTGWHQEVCFFKVSRYRGGHEGRATMMRLVHLQEEKKTSSHSLEHVAIIQGKGGCLQTMKWSFAWHQIC
jgi:hypothetical protein